MPRGVDRALAAITWAAAALMFVLLFTGPGVIGVKKSGAVGYGASGGSSYGGSSYGGSSYGSSGQGSVATGSAVFASAGCGGCHTLKAAHATGSIGPDLDQVHPSASTVRAIVQSGAGTMPSFAGKLSAAQIAAVAQFVSTHAGR